MPLWLRSSVRAAFLQKNRLSNNCLQMFTYPPLHAAVMVFQRLSVRGRLLLAHFEAGGADVALVCFTYLEHFIETNAFGILAAMQDRFLKRYIWHTR